MLYSYLGSCPAPLPFRIMLSNGFSRTDPATFTQEEIEDAGFYGPFLEPPYDPSSEKLEWDGTQFTIVPIPPSPDWPHFKELAVGNTALNSLLSQAYQVCPVAASAIATALTRAELGDYSDFRIFWPAIVNNLSVPSQVLEDFAISAESCNLPEDFINIIRCEF